MISRETHESLTSSALEVVPCQSMPARERIPIYDATAPVACTISEAEIPDRIALLERMRASLDAIERTTTGLFLRFGDESAVRSDLVTFTADEKQCCQFWGFAIVDLPAGVGLRWDAPPH